MGQLLGIVVATQSIASVAAQAPAGRVGDRSQHKNWLIIAAASIVALGCIGIVRLPMRPAKLLHKP